MRSAEGCKARAAKILRRREAKEKKPGRGGARRGLGGGNRVEPKWDTMAFPNQPPCVLYSAVMAVSTHRVALRQIASQGHAEVLVRRRENAAEELQGG